VRLALLRHGHTAWNRAGRLQGRIDQPLDDEARTHLSRLRLPNPFVNATLFSSPLVRAVETARLVSGREPLIVPDLIEMDWGAFEGQRGVDLIEDSSSGHRHIEDWGWDFRPPGGETPHEVWLRVEPWLRALRGDAVAVAHMGVMRAILARATGWDFAGPPPFKVKRDRLYVVDIAADGALSHDNIPVRLIPAEPS